MTSTAPWDATSWSLDHVRTIGPFDQKIIKLIHADGWLIAAFEDGTEKHFPPGSFDDYPLPRTPKVQP